MDWLKDLSPAALQLVGLIYVVHYLGGELRSVCSVLTGLVAEVSCMRGRMNGMGAAERGGRAPSATHPPYTCPGMGEGA